MIQASIARANTPMAARSLTGLNVLSSTEVWRTAGPPAARFSSVTVIFFPLVSLRVDGLGYGVGR